MNARRTGAVVGGTQVDERRRHGPTPAIDFARGSEAFPGGDDGETERTLRCGGGGGFGLPPALVW